MLEYKSFLTDTLLKFVEFKKASRSWNKTYAGFLKRFDNWLFQNYPEEKVLTQKMVDDYSEILPTETINSNIGRVLLVAYLIRYMRKRELTDVKEPDRPAFQKRTYIPHVFTEKELTNFFYACDHIKITTDGKSAKARKLILCVIFRLMYCTGIRPNEARMLRREDVDLQECVLNIVNTKGNIQHYVPIHESLIDTLEEYDRRMEKLIPNRIYFFPNGKDSYFCNCWLWGHFSKLWNQSNPNTYAISYHFRHNYATVNINRWVNDELGFYTNLYYLSKSMGHRKLDSTKYYYSLVPQLSKIIEEKSGSSFDDLVPEMIEDEIW